MPKNIKVTFESSEVELDIHINVDGVLHLVNSLEVCL